MIYLPIVGIAAFIILYCLLRTLLSFLAAGRHSVGEEITYIGVTLGSGVLAVFLARGIYRLISDPVCALIIEKIKNARVENWMDLMPTGVAGLEELIGLLLVPLLFLVSFLFLHLVGTGIAHIPWRVARSKREKSYEYFPKRNWVTSSMGGVNGFLISLCVLIPLCGYITLISGTAMDFVETGAYETKTVQKVVTKNIGADPDRLLEYVEKLDKNPVIGMFGKGPGHVLFSELTAGMVEADEETVPLQLETELHTIATAGGYGIRMAEMISKKSVNLSEEDRESVLALKSAILSSKWLTQTGAEAVSGIATEWSQDRAFDKLKKPRVNDVLKPTFDLAIQLLCEEDAELFREDAETLTGIMLDLVESRLFVKNIDYNVVMERLGENGLMLSILNRLLENDHLAPLADELESLSVRVVASVLDTDKLIEGAYDELVGEVSLRLNNVLNLTREEREEEVRAAISEVFVNYGYEVPDDVAISVSEQLIATLGEDGEITPEELKQYLIDNNAQIIINP